MTAPPRHPPTPLVAVLKGKLGRVDSSEDLLTAIVFGTLAWMPPTLGTLPLLRRLDHAQEPPAWLRGIHRVDVELWPWWDHHEVLPGAEPDVVLTLHQEGATPRLVVVEAKRDAKLGDAQLLRQAASGRLVAQERGAVFAGLIYLTPHVGRPHAELNAATAELRKREYDDPVWWLSWRDLLHVFTEGAAQLRGTAPMVAASAADAARCLERWGLVRFQGWSSITPMPSWSFHQQETS